MFPWVNTRIIPKDCSLITNKAIVKALKDKLNSVNITLIFNVEEPYYYHDYTGGKFPFMISFRKKGVIHVVADAFVYSHIEYYKYLGEVFLKFDIRTDLPFEEVLDRLTGYSTKAIDPTEITYFDPIIFKEGREAKNVGYDDQMNTYFGALDKMFQLEETARVFHFASELNLKYNIINTIAVLYEPQGIHYHCKLVQYKDPYFKKMQKRGEESYSYWLFEITTFKNIFLFCRIQKSSKYKLNFVPSFQNK